MVAPITSFSQATTVPSVAVKKTQSPVRDTQLLEEEVSFLSLPRSGSVASIQFNDNVCLV